MTRYNESMNTWLAAVVAATLCTVVPAVGLAGGAGFSRFPQADGDILNVNDARHRMIVLADEDELHFVVIFAPDPAEGFDERMFYGDGKEFYAVPMRAWSWNDDGTRITMTFEDPRYTSLTELEYKDDQWVVTCGKATTTLRHPKGPKIKHVMESATFSRSPHDWNPYALARNEAGEYFYVDRGRWDDNRKQFRVYRGFKGRLEEQKLTNVVNDSEGDIFSTTSGDLRLVLNRKEYWWVARAEKKSESARERLTIVPPERNIPMIYNDLGVYAGARLGTPCDDL